MHNWNHVKLQYCDGGSFSGASDRTAEHNGTALHFRGKHIREAVVADLFAKHSFGNASDMMVGGCSAGGLAVYLHADQWCDALKATNRLAKCAALPNSGFFLDYQDPNVRCSPSSPTRTVETVAGSSGPNASNATAFEVLGTMTTDFGDTINGNYQCGLKWVYNIQNATGGVNSDCIKAHAADKTQWQCMFAEHSAEHLRTPVFAMQSQYDAWQITHVQGPGRNLGAGDSTGTSKTPSVRKTQQLGNNITARLKSMLLGHNNESGAFLDSCKHHCGEWNAIRIDGDLVSAAVEKWYNGIGSQKPNQKKLWEQGKKYPCSTCCTP
jgi:hypothetical protein